MCIRDRLRTVDTQHGSNSLTVLVQICEVNTICQQVSDYLLQQGYEMCKVLSRASGTTWICELMTFRNTTTVVTANSVHHHTDHTV